MAFKATRPKSASFLPKTRETPVYDAGEPVADTPEVAFSVDDLIGVPKKT